LVLTLLALLSSTLAAGILFVIFTSSSFLNFFCLNLQLFNLSFATFGFYNMDLTLNHFLEYGHCQFSALTANGGSVAGYAYVGTNSLDATKIDIEISVSGLSFTSADHGVHIHEVQKNSFFKISFFKIRFFHIFR
jgi:hypothetical protein